MYIDLEIPKDRKDRSTLKLWLALGATLCMNMASPQTAPVDAKAKGFLVK